MPQVIPQTHRGRIDLIVEVRDLAQQVGSLLGALREVYPKSQLWQSLHMQAESLVTQLQTCLNDVEGVLNDRLSR